MRARRSDEKPVCSGLAVWTEAASAGRAAARITASTDTERFIGNSFSDQGTWLLADEVRSVVNRTRAGVGGDLRVGTQGTRAVNFAGSRMGGDHLFGGRALFHPLIEGGESIEGVGPIAAAAMAHTGHKKHADLLVDLEDAAHLLSDVLVIADGGFGRDQLIGPAVIQEKFSIVGQEWLDVGVPGIGQTIVGLNGSVDVLVEVEGAPVPLRILEHDVLELIHAERIGLGTAQQNAPTQLVAG